MATSGGTESLLVVIVDVCDVYRQSVEAEDATQRVSEDHVDILFLSHRTIDSLTLYACIIYIYMYISSIATVINY